MTSPWAVASREQTTATGREQASGVPANPQNPLARLPSESSPGPTQQQQQPAFVFDPSKPVSNQAPAVPNDAVSNAAKNFTFGQGQSGGGRPVLGGGNGGFSGQPPNPPQQVGFGRGGPPRVVFNPARAQPGPPKPESNWGPPPASGVAQSTLTMTHWEPVLQEAANDKSKSTGNSSNNNNNIKPANENEASGAEEVKADDASLIRKALHRKMGLIKTKADLEIIRNDPNSPLHSVKSFDELSLKPEVLQGIYGMGFRYPSRIQETALPILLFDNPRHNLIAQSQSGTGKTAAFVLTMLMRVDVAKRYPQALCVAPTYELALQIGAVTEEMGRYMNGLEVGYAVRGSSNAGSNAGPLTSQIIIGTPGTVMDWGLKFRKLDLSKLVVFVLDEADVMIAMQGHRDSSFRIKTKLSPACQLLLFSATYDDEVFDFAQKMVPNADIIKLKREELSLDNVKQFVVGCASDQEKYNAICAIYGSITIGQSMIFCERRNAADWLAGRMSKDGHQVGLLHGGLTVEQRANIIERFREAKERVLITTNVAARGIDIEQVTVVVNYDLPLDIKTHRIEFDTYLHRIGRAGRFGRVGLALNLISSPHEMTHIKAIEDHFGRKIEPLDVSDVEELANKLEASS